MTFPVNYYFDKAERNRKKADKKAKKLAAREEAVMARKLARLTESKSGASDDIPRGHVHRCIMSERSQP